MYYVKIKGMFFSQGISSKPIINLVNRGKGTECLEVLLHPVDLVGMFFLDDGSKYIETAFKSYIVVYSK